MSMMGGTASVPGRGNARLQLRSPSSIAVYDSYEDAQHAVDYLADRSFPVQFLSIVGTDLKSVERITGGLSWSRVLAGAAMNGLVWGIMAALLFYFFVPNVSVALVFLGAIVVFVLANMFTSAISYAMTGGRRDFTSSSQIVATRYEVLGENEVAGQARQLLAGGRPA
ncbi:general stress protein, partial [uncultured Propionibacterium sp.]|uniref:general stress protein n=1 Tax=uncultured Propionibacterium sp. TaxID=218066 RepID=UPI00292D17F1